jgi:3-oxoacyl-[acyl-carrier protein] reductase
MNRTALITGGSRGIGLGIALELAAEGFDLVINGVREKSAVKPVLDEIKARGTEAIYLQGDVSVGADRVRIVDQALEKMGRLNVLVNNAGIAPPVRQDILKATTDSFDKVISTNLKGPYFLTQLVANHMIEQKKKDPEGFYCIINVSSVSATVVSIDRGEYCISKAGIGMATLLWAARLGEFGIPVYEIQPGVIKTDMTSGVQEKYNRLFSQGEAVLSRWGLPSDVGKVAAAMATGSMPYTTGQAVKVDGGLTIRRL